MTKKVSKSFDGSSFVFLLSSHYNKNKIIPLHSSNKMKNKYFLQNAVFKTLRLDIFLDIYFCPFSKISVDFLAHLFIILKS